LKKKKSLFINKNYERNEFGGRQAAAAAKAARSLRHMREREELLE
jgi:hypothetical protein